MRFSTRDPFVRRLGGDRYEIKVPVPIGPDGRIGRECPNSECSPGSFRVKPGTGIVAPSQSVAYCPYCRFEAEPSDFTPERVRKYAREVAFNEVTREIVDPFLSSLRKTLKGLERSSRGMIRVQSRGSASFCPQPHRPLQEALIRDLVCPHCGLDHAVYGFATWCPDCGENVLPVHVSRELLAVRQLIAPFENRQDHDRASTRAIENALEDVVSVFEASMKHLVVGRVVEIYGEEVAASRLKRIGNGFQNIGRACEILSAEVAFSLIGPVPESVVQRVSQIFEKRHVITHNLGVVDARFQKRTGDARLGREVSVSRYEIEFSIDFVNCAVTSLVDHLAGTAASLRAESPP